MPALCSANGRAGGAGSAILAGFAGVLIITRPGVGVFGVGHVFALCSMLSNCFYIIMTRRMSATETSESLILFSALAPAVLLLPLLPFSASCRRTAGTGSSCSSLGVFGAVGHWLLVHAYRLATATALAPYPYLQMVWMIVFGCDRLQPVSRPLDAGRAPPSSSPAASTSSIASTGCACSSSAALDTEDEELAKKL